MYELQFDYLNTHYFNAIPSFSNPLFEQGDLLSQHRYDISQRTTRFHLGLRPGRRVSPFVAYQRTSRQGPLTTTLAGGGDEFVLSSELDLHSDDIRGGVNLSFSKLSLLLEQGFRWYRDESPFSGSAQAGNSTRTTFGRDIFLENYQGQTDVDSSIPFSTALAVYRPLDQLSLRGKLSYSIADLDSAYSDDINGNFFSQPLAAFYQQGRSESVGAVKQPNLLGDFSAEWQPWNRLRVVERVQIRRLHVSGSSLVNSFLSDVDRLLEPDADIQTSTRFDTFLSMDTNVQELEGLFYVTPRLAFRLGHRYEHKEVRLQEAFAWDRNVLISGVTYDFTRHNQISLDYELGRTDQPIFRLDPVDFERLRIRGKFSPTESLRFSGSASLFDHDDDFGAIDFTSRNRVYSLEFTYDPLSRVSLSGQYERSRISTNLLYIIPQTFQPDRFLYTERGDYGSLYVSLELIRRSRLNLGYSVWGTVGDFPLTYHQPMAALEVPLGERLVAYGQWNHYDYNEKLQLFPQDYRTHLITFGVRVSGKPDDLDRLFRWR